MAKLIKIGERIINLDEIAFARREKDKNGIEAVSIFFERGEKFSVPAGQPIYKGTKDDPIPISLNMKFYDKNAEYVWKKLCEEAEEWILPGEIEPDVSGGWNES